MDEKELQRREERIERIRQCSKDIRGLVGFGAVVDLGRKLNEDEVDKIARYSEARGADYESVVEVLESRGRPYDVSDARFTSKCLLCHSLRNYCHC
jgi:hypothetical protein